MPLKLKTQHQVILVPFAELMSVNWCAKLWMEKVLVNCSKNLPANIFTCYYCWKGYLIPNHQENGCSFQFLKRFCVCSAHFLFLLKKPSDELSIHKYLMSPLFCYYVIFSCICNDGILPLSLLHCALPCIEKNVVSLNLHPLHALKLHPNMKL